MEVEVGDTESEEEECSDVQQLCRMCAQQCSRMSSSLLHNNPTLVYKLDVYFDIQVCKIYIIFKLLPDEYKNLNITKYKDCWIFFFFCPKSCFWCIIFV
jgi:hypothetical protein